MSAAAGKAELRTALDRVLHGARRRWRARKILEGAALALALVLLAGIAAIGVMDAWLFEPGAVSRTRVAFYLAAAATLIFVLLPAIARAPDDVMAHYLETRAPHLDALMLSAVEARALLGGAPRADTSPALARRLVDRAAREFETSPTLAGLERRRTRRAFAALGAITVTAALLLSLGPDAWRHGALLLLRPPQDPALSNPYTFRVVPGNTTILAGEDVRISATPEGFEPDGVMLVYRGEGDTEWTRTPLNVSADTGAFESFLFDVSAATDYRVEHASLRSPGFRIEVVPRPLAERIDLLYEFPGHTGRAPELVTGGGDIAAVRGSRVEVRVTPSDTTARGRLVLDGERFLDLRAEVNGEMRATIDVRENGRYRVELEAGNYGMVPASPEYAIAAYVDTLPKIALQSPGRDVRVTSIEEVAIDVRAEDDVAVRDLEIVLSVNGGPDEVIVLNDPSNPQPAVEERLELFLEERDLAPGDLIAYHVRARDAPGDSARQFTSDIYFMDVRPFEMSYRPSGGAGGGGGGRAGAQQEETLAAQQRTLVVAMFKLLRDRASMAGEVLAERLETLNQAQARIRDRVEAIVRRLGARSIVDLNPGYRRMAEELPEAAKSMLEVEALLANNDLQGALPAARFALLHLQRAESAFREVQVAQARQQGGGAAASSDLQNLFRLEMDRFRNQYEDMRRGDWRPRNQQIDDTMRKLRDLAERQQRELERAQLRARRGGAGSNSQRALAEEVEKLMRELERLTRRESSEELRASLRALENAARAMRRSAGEGGAAAGAEALDRLREARRLLDSEGPARLARDTGEAMRRAEQMIEKQGGIERGVERGRRQGDREPGGAAGLAERKRSLAEDVNDMETRLDRLAEQAGRQKQPDAARSLKGAADGLREDEVGERVRRSAEEIARNPEAVYPSEEDDISRALRLLRDRIASASDQIGEPDGARLSRMLDELRGNMRGLERDRERLEDRARRGPALPGRGSRADVDPADLADFRRALEQRAGGIGGLAEALAGEPGLAGDLAGLLSALEGARLKEDMNAETLARRHAELLAALKKIELELRARLGETPQSASAVARSEPPPSHREIVERYYRNLSEKSSP